MNSETSRLGKATIIEDEASIRLIVGERYFVIAWEVVPRTYNVLEEAHMSY